MRHAKPMVTGTLAAAVVVAPSLLTSCPTATATADGPPEHQPASRVERVDARMPQIEGADRAAPRPEQRPHHAEQHGVTR